MNLLPLMLMTCLVSVTAEAEVAKKPAKLVRLAIVDNSGSMNGERIKVVRDELTNLLQQLPPSAEYPFELVQFSGTAEAGVVCEDMQHAITAVSELQGNGSGGTSIAAGLRGGYADLQKWQHAENVVVILYTDFQDTDREGIREAEKQLDAWFGKRSQAGKKQSVFVKQWGGQEGALLEILSQSPHVKAFRVGELKIQSVTIEPRIAVDSVRQKDNVLHVELIAGGRAKGHAGGETLGHLEFRCVRSDVKGEVTFGTSVGSAIRSSVTLEIPNGQHDGTIVLPFVVALDRADTTTQGSFLLPVLLMSRIEVPVEIPKTEVRYAVTATLEMKHAPTWADPIGLLARYPVTLAFDVPRAKEEQATGESSFRITSKGACRIIEGETTFTMAGPGEYRVPLVVEAEAINPGVPLEELRFPLALDIKPIRVPPNVHWQPAVLSIERNDLRAPDPLVALVETELVSIDRVLWFDVAESLAIIDAKVAVTVTGRIPSTASFSLAKPAGVHQTSLQPQKLRPGRHVVTMRMVVSIEPHPQKVTFNFHVLPTAPRSVGVELLAKDPLQITLSGPRRAQLLFTDGKAAIGHLHRTVADNCRSIEFDVVPWMHGIYSKGVAKKCRAKLLCKDERFCLESTSLQLFERQRLSLVPPRTTGSFFRDQEDHVELWIVPEKPMSAVAPTRLRAEITRLAPFKRLLFYLSVAVCSLGAVALLVRLVVKLREPVE